MKIRFGILAALTFAVADAPAEEVSVSLRSDDYGVVGFQIPSISITPSPGPISRYNLNVSGPMVVNFRGTLWIPKIAVPASVIKGVKLVSTCSMAASAGGSLGGSAYYVMAHDGRAGFPRNVVKESGSLSAGNGSIVSALSTGDFVIPADNIASFVLTGQGGEATEIQVDLVCQLLAQVNGGQIPQNQPRFASFFGKHVHPKFRLVYDFVDGFVPPPLEQQGDGPELTWADGVVVDMRPSPPPPEDWWPGEVTGQSLKQEVETLSPGNYNLRVLGLSGYNYTLESTEDFGDFTPIDTRAGDGREMLFEVRRSGEKPQAFYRIRSQPKTN